MRYITLKNTDLKVGSICLGGDKFGDKLNPQESFALLDAYVALGGNFIDTANVYCRWVKDAGNCSEKIIGEWLKSRNAYKKVVISTKGGHYDINDPDKKSRITKEDIRSDLEESLTTLGLPCIDFYWLHRDDPSRPIEEIIDILLDLRKEGKLRYYGLSNYKTSRLADAHRYLLDKGEPGLYGSSNQWSLARENKGFSMNADPTLVYCDSDEVEWHKKSGVPILPYSSSAFGFFQKLRNQNVLVKDGEIISEGGLASLPKKLGQAYINKENLKKYEQLLLLEKETGHSIQALSIAYLMDQPFQVVPMGSARNIEQLNTLIEASNL